VRKLYWIQSKKFSVESISLFCPRSESSALMRKVSNLFAVASRRHEKASERKMEWQMRKLLTSKYYFVLVKKWKRGKKPIRHSSFSRTFHFSRSFLQNICQSKSSCFTTRIERCEHKYMTWIESSLKPMKVHFCSSLFFWNFGSQKLLVSKSQHEL